VENAAVVVLCLLEATVEKWKLTHTLFYDIMNKPLTYGLAPERALNLEN
jgi:hypothetical protein